MLKYHVLSVTRPLWWGTRCWHGSTISIHITHYTWARYVTRDTWPAVQWAVILIASVTNVYFHARPISDRKVHRNFRSMQLQQQQQQPSAMSVVNNYTAKLIGPLCLTAVWRDLGAEPESALNNEKLFASPLFGDCHSSPGPASGVISPVTSHTGSWLVAPPDIGWWGHTRGIVLTLRHRTHEAAASHDQDLGTPAAPDAAVGAKRQIYKASSGILLYQISRDLTRLCNFIRGQLAKDRIIGAQTADIRRIAG